MAGYRRALHPDVVLLAVYVGNDVADVLMHEVDFGGFGRRFQIASLDGKDGQWQILLPGWHGGLLGRADWLLQCQLRLYSLLRRTLERSSREGGGLKRVAQHCFGCLQSLWQAAVAHTDPAQLAQGVERLDYVFGLLVEGSRTGGMPLLAVVIPTKVEVEGGSVQEETQRAAEMLGLRYDAAAFEGAVRERIVGLLERRGVPTVDLLPALRAAFAARGAPLFWAADWHLNVAGHAVVADAVAPVLGGILARERSPIP